MSLRNKAVSLSRECLSRLLPPYQHRVLRPHNPESGHFLQNPQEFLSGQNDGLGQTECVLLALLIS